MNRLFLLSVAGWVCAVGASAEEVSVLFDGTSAGGWSPRRGTGRLQQEFSLSRISVDPAESCLRWQFTSKGVAFNDLFLDREVVRPFTEVRLRVRNAGAPLTLAMKAGDANGAEWTTSQHKLPAAGDWQTVTFPFDDWRVASWSRDDDGTFDTPLPYLTVIAFDIGHQQPCDLRIASLETVFPPPPVARVSGLRAPTALTAGDAWRLAFDLTLDRACRLGRTEIVFLDGELVTVRLPLPLPVPLPELEPGRAIHVVVNDLRFPRFARGGDLQMTLRFGEARTRLVDRPQAPASSPVTVNPRVPGTCRSEVRQWRGRPTLFINGEPHNGMAYTAYHPSVKVFREFTEAGVDLFSFSATPTEAGYNLSRTTWTAPDTYDYSQLDERVLMVLEANPDAFIFPRLYLHAPRWWSAENPDDLVQYDPGTGEPERFIHSGNKPAPSWASETWRRDTIRALQKLIEHVESSPYADRVIGYHLASGTTEEWMMWGANENQWVGYSPATTADFRGWLSAKYGDDRGLQAAWQQPDASLGDAAVPPRAERARSQLGPLRDPAGERHVIDFYDYNSDLVADTIADLATAVKRLTGGTKTVGVFYGYTLQLCGQQRQQNAGHQALERVLECPDVDFLCSPTSYAFRQLGGEGTCHFMAPYGSVRRRGKLWFNENDVRTSLTAVPAQAWGRPETLEGDLIQQDKELGHALSNGAAQWWFDVGRNRYDHPRLMGHIAGWVRAADRALEADRTPAAQVALVVDEKGTNRLKTGHHWGTWLLLAQLPALHRIGAPVDHLLTGDLDRLSAHRLLILPTSMEPDAAQMTALEALKSGGRTLLFLGYPGIFAGGRIDPEAMGRFCGIRLDLRQAPTALRVSTNTAGQAAGFPACTYGPGPEIAPVAVPADSEAEVLGTLPDGTPGLVRKRFGDWTAVFSAAPLLPAGILRRLADDAGAHLYITTEDVVWATRDVVSISAYRPGERVVRLRRSAEVIDLFTGEPVAADGSEFRVDFEERQTRTFLLR